MRKKRMKRKFRRWMRRRLRKKMRRRWRRKVKRMVKYMRHARRFWRGMSPEQRKMKRSMGYDKLQKMLPLKARIKYEWAVLVSQMMDTSVTLETLKGQIKKIAEAEGAAAKAYAGFHLKFYNTLNPEQRVHVGFMHLKKMSMKRRVKKRGRRIMMRFMRLVRRKIRKMRRRWRRRKMGKGWGHGLRRWFRGRRGMRRWHHNMKMKKHRKHKHFRRMPL